MSNDSSDLKVPTAPQQVATDTSSNQLGITTRVDTGVVRSSEAVSPTSAPATAAGAPPAPLPVRTPGGTAVHDPKDITPDDVVRLPGYGETTVAVAMSLGLMTRNAAGHIVPSGTDPSATLQDSLDQSPTKEANPRLDDESEAVMADALTRAPGETVGAAVSIITNGGEPSDSIVTQLASRLSVEPAQVRARIESLKQAYTKEAVTTSAKATGFSEALAREALEAAQRTGSSELRQVQEAHVMTGRPDYAAFVIDYAAKLDQHDPARVLEGLGGIGRWCNQSKQVLVKVGNTEVPWEAAVRQRLLKIS